MNKCNLLFFKNIKNGKEFCRNYCDEAVCNLPDEQDFVDWIKVETTHIEKLINYTFCVRYILYIAEMVKYNKIEEIKDYITKQDFPCYRVRYYFNELKPLVLYKKEMDIE